MILGAATTWDWYSFTDAIAYNYGHAAMIGSDGKYYTLYNGVIRNAAGGAIYTFPTAANAYQHLWAQVYRPCANGDWFYLARVFAHEVHNAFTTDYYLYPRIYAYNPITGTATTIYSNNYTDNVFASFSEDGYVYADVSVDPISGIGLAILQGSLTYGGGTLERRICGTFTAGVGVTAPSGFSTTGLLNTASGVATSTASVSAWDGVGYVNYATGGEFLYREIADLTAPSLVTITHGGDQLLSFPGVGPHLVRFDATGDSQIIRQYAPAARAWDVSAAISTVGGLSYLGEDSIYWYVIVGDTATAVPHIFALQKDADVCVDLGHWGSATTTSWLPAYGLASIVITNGATASKYGFPIRSVQPVRVGPSAFRILKLPIMEVY